MSELFHVLPHTGASVGRLQMPSRLPGGVAIRQASPLDEVVINEAAVRGLHSGVVLDGLDRVSIVLLLQLGKGAVKTLTPQEGGRLAIGAQTGDVEHRMLPPISKGQAQLIRVSVGHADNVKGLDELRQQFRTLPRLLSLEVGSRQEHLVAHRKRASA
jgi:hypothetical protein